jgi:uncharacterized membrane protein
MSVPLTSHAFQRVLLIDRIRGVAIVLMVAYHFSFDLYQYGWIHQAFNTDPRWLAFRALIICLFMGSLGASLGLAHPGPVRLGALWRRQLRLGVAAVSVTAGSALLFPTSFIWFGILHFAWIATLLALPLRRLPGPLLLVSAVLVTWAGNGPSVPQFDAPWLGWIGFMSQKPYTEDYVPLFPWFAPVLVGLACAPALGARRAAEPGRDAISRFSLPAVERLDGALRRVGRHTLLIYLLHQPVLIGLLEAAQRLR